MRAPVAAGAATGNAAGVTALPSGGRARALLAGRLARALTALLLPTSWWASAVARPALANAGAPAAGAPAAPAAPEVGLVVVGRGPLPVRGLVAEPVLVAELAPHGLGPQAWRAHGAVVAWWLEADAVVVADRHGQQRLPAPTALTVPVPGWRRPTLTWPLPAEPIVLPETLPSR